MTTESSESLRRRRPLIVQKFGGSSVATPAHILAVAQRIGRVRQSGTQPIVVVSAMGDTTDALLALMESVTRGSRGRNAREIDAALATGEQLAAALLAVALEVCGVSAVSLTGPQAGIKTDDSYGTARIRRVDVQRIHDAIDSDRTPVIAGFQGLSSAGNVTTLGRGGSDTTAVAVAIAANASRCDIFTDVDGIYTADPRFHPNARRHDRLTNHEALLLAAAGATVLHPRAAALAAAARLPLRVLSTFNPDDSPCTLITGDEQMEGPRILGVTVARDMVRIMVDVPATDVSAPSLLAAFTERNLCIESLEETTIGDAHRRMIVVLRAEHLDNLTAAVAEVAGPGVSVHVERTTARVTVVGTGLSQGVSSIGVALSRLATAGIRPTACGISEMGLTLDVELVDADRAVGVLHEALIEPGTVEELVG